MYTPPDLIWTQGKDIVCSQYVDQKKNLQISKMHLSIFSHTPRKTYSYVDEAVYTSILSFCKLICVFAVVHLAILIFIPIISHMNTLMVFLWSSFSPKYHGFFYNSRTKENVIFQIHVIFWTNCNASKQCTFLMSIPPVLLLSHAKSNQVLH